MEVPPEPAPPEPLPLAVRLPGFVAQYGIAVPAGVWVGAVVALPILLGTATVAPTLGFVAAVAAFVGASGVTAIAISQRIRAFQERRLLAASDAPSPPRQLKAAGGSSPVAVRD